MPRPQGELMSFSNAKNCKDQLPDWFRLDVASLKAEAAAAVLALAFLHTNFVTLKHSYDQVEKPTHVSKVVPKQWGFDKSYLSAKPTPWHSSSKNVNENIFNKKKSFGSIPHQFWPGVRRTCGTASKKRNWRFGSWVGSGILFSRVLWILSRLVYTSG